MYAKQTQFAGQPNECKLCQNKELRTMNTNHELTKTNPIKANPKAASDRANRIGVEIFPGQRARLFPKRRCVCP